MLILVELTTLALALQTAKQPELTPQKLESLITIQIPKHDFDKEVGEPLRQKQEAQRALEASQVVIAPEPVYVPETVYIAPQPVPVAQNGFVGSVGYSLSGGNCVREAGVNNPGYGNPINWQVTSSIPWIGATVLFTFNHTAVVSGIYGDGSIEVRQQNSPGMSHHIYPGQVRGYR